jgi:hypothetical protein
LLAADRQREHGKKDKETCIPVHTDASWNWN